jgi:hypothetical protein
MSFNMIGIRRIAYSGTLTAHMYSGPRNGFVMSTAEDAKLSLPSDSSFPEILSVQSFESTHVAIQFALLADMPTLNLPRSCAYPIQSYSRPPELSRWPERDSEHDHDE